MAEYKSYENEFKKNLKELDEEINEAQNNEQLREIREKVQQLEKNIQELVDKMKSDLDNGYIKKKDIKEIENRIAKFNGFLKNADGKLKYLDEKLKIEHKELEVKDVEEQQEEKKEEQHEEQQEEKEDSNEKQISNKEKELKEVADMRKIARQEGNDQMYAEANSRYARLLEEIDKLKNLKKEQEAPVNDNAEKISNFERRLRECAKRMADAKRDGNMQAYAEENSRYAYLVEEIDKLKKIEKEPEKEPGNIIDVYTIPNPGKKEEKLEFEEILAKIEAAQNALSDADVRRIQNASSPLLPAVVKDKNDWLHNALRAAANICTLPGRLIGKGISKLLTNKTKKEKLQNIIKNVEELPEEEFETLKNGLASYKGIEGKVSASVRNAVIQREKRAITEKTSKLDQQTAILNETISKNMDSIKEIDKKLENKLLSQNRKEQLLAQREELLAVTTADIANVKLNREETAKMQGGLGLHGLEEEDRAAREGANINGRKLGKRYSDDVELQNKEAEIVRKERLARENGDKYAEVEAYLEHEGLLTENTTTTNVLGIEVSRSQRIHSAGVVHKEYENDDLLRNLMTIGFTAAQVQSIMHQISIQKQVNAHNQQIDSINQTNQANATLHNQQIDEIKVTATTTRGRVVNAQKQEGVLENITSSTSNHEAIGISNNYRNGWGKTSADIEHHAREAAGTTLPVNEAVNNLSNALQGESSHFNRTALSNSVEQFIKNGGSQVISNGYNATYNLINKAQQLGKIVYDQAGHLTIKPDIFPFITATIGKYTSFGKMKNEIETNKENETDNELQNSPNVEKEMMMNNNEGNTKYQDNNLNFDIRQNNLSDEGWIPGVAKGRKHIELSTGSTTRMGTKPKEDIEER